MGHVTTIRHVTLKGFISSGEVTFLFPSCHCCCCYCRHFEIPPVAMMSCSLLDDND